MIKFHCKNCDQKFSVPEIHAGKKGKCPKCKSVVVIPKTENTDLGSGQTNITIAEEHKPSLSDSELRLKREPPIPPIKTSNVFSDSFEVTHKYEQKEGLDTAQTAQAGIGIPSLGGHVFTAPCSVAGKNAPSGGKD